MPAPLAQPPQAPEPTPELALAREAHAERVARGERLERRSVIRGLLVLALLILVASMARAGLGRVFPPNWWRP
jgi:hypothetical protein